MTLTFDLWPWKYFQQFPLPWRILVVSFIEILPISKKYCITRVIIIIIIIIIQWWRYTKARQVKLPGWKIHRPGSALPSPTYCFASVMVWTENKNVAISDRFICFVLTVKRRWRPVFWGRQLKKVVNFFEEKKCIRVTWLEDFLTSKWPGSFTALAPPLSSSSSSSSVAEAAAVAASTSFTMVTTCPMASEEQTSRHHLWLAWREHLHRQPTCQTSSSWPDSAVLGGHLH